MDALIWDRADNGPGPLAQWVHDYLNFGTTPSRRKLEQSLTGPAQSRLNELVQLWRQPDYRGYGLYGFAGRLSGQARNRLVRQAIDAADQYFKLLSMWNDLKDAVIALPREDSDNGWLFRPPV